MGADRAPPHGPQPPSFRSGLPSTEAGGFGRDSGYFGGSLPGVRTPPKPGSLLFPLIFLVCTLHRSYPPPPSSSRSALRRFFKAATSGKKASHQPRACIPVISASHNLRLQEIHENVLTSLPFARARHALVLGGPARLCGGKPLDALADRHPQLRRARFLPRCRSMGHRGEHDPGSSILWSARPRSIGFESGPLLHEIPPRPQPEAPPSQVLHFTFFGAPPAQRCGCCLHITRSLHNQHLQKIRSHQHEGHARCTSQSDPTFSMNRMMRLWPWSCARCTDSGVASLWLCLWPPAESSATAPG